MPLLILLTSKGTKVDIVVTSLTTARPTRPYVISIYRVWTLIPLWELGRRAHPPQIIPFKSPHSRKQRERRSWYTIKRLA